MSAIEEEIEAVKFILASYFNFPNEADRNEPIRAKALTNKHIATYARFPEDALQKQLGLLQSQFVGGGTLPTPPLLNTSPHPSEVEHPSTASNAAKFRDELKRLKLAKVKVQHVSNFTTTETSSVYDLFQCTETPENKLNELYPFYDPKYDAYEIKWQELLSAGNKEDVCQAQINETLVKRLQLATDTSASSCGMFKPAREMRLFAEPDAIEAAVYTPSAKIDSVGVDSPQAFEIKPSPRTTEAAAKPVDSDIDLLEQVLVRMSVEIYCNALLSNFTVLAATGRFAWIVVFERKLEFFNAPPEQGFFEVITIRRIRHSDLLKVFFSNVKRCELEPRWFLTADAAHLVNTIGRLSYPGLCSTRLYDKSESNVYAVCLPRTYTAKNRRYVGPATSHVDLMIKVVHSKHSFETESSALAEIAPAYNKMEPRSTEDRHYALGTCSYRTVAPMIAAEETALVSAMENARITNDGGDYELYDEVHEEDAGQRGTSPLERRIKIADLTVKFWEEFNSIDAPFSDFSERPLIAFSHPCAWRDVEKLKKLLLSNPLDGGTVVMRVGTPLTMVSQKVRVNDWREGVCKCLLAGSMVQWSQGDTRLRNTLLFGRRIQLIDYNHAVKLSVVTDGAIPCGQRQFKEGSLYRSLGPRLANVVLDTITDWTSADDYEMAMRSMEELTMA